MPEDNERSLRDKTMSWEELNEVVRTNLKAKYLLYYRKTSLLIPKRGHEGGPLLVCRKITFRNSKGKEEVLWEEKDGQDSMNKLMRLIWADDEIPHSQIYPNNYMESLDKITNSSTIARR